MASPSFATREAFHLFLVRQLAVRFAGRAWAVKGGIGLRFFHRSARLSEDLDVDVAAGMRAETVRTGVEAVLAGRALKAMLAGAGIEGVRASSAKQTQTTQRWKVALDLGSGGTLPTKVEFSRRRDRIDAVTGVPGAEILAAHQCPPFAVPHYEALSMAVQKTFALAAPGRHAPRDLFDLDHLLTHGGVGPAALRKASGSATAAAAAKAADFSPASFAAEVTPFLTEELVELYRSAAAFRALQRRVVEALGGA